MKCSCDSGWWSWHSVHTTFAQRGGAGTPAAGGGGGTPAAAGGEAGGGGVAGGAAAAAAQRDQGSDAVLKALEIQKWYSQLGDIAEVNEIRYTSAPPHRPLNPPRPAPRTP